MEKRNPNQAVAEAARKLARALEAKRQALRLSVEEYEVASYRTVAARRALAEAVALAKTEGDSLSITSNVGRGVCLPESR